MIISRIIIDTYDAEIGTSLSASDMAERMDTAARNRWPGIERQCVRNGRGSHALDADGFTLEHETATLSHVLLSAWEDATETHPYVDDEHVAG